MSEPEEDEHYFVVNGRRWRRQDPSIPEDVVRRLTSQLGRARNEVKRLKGLEEDPAPARRRVSLAKHGLGERGTPWWEQDADERRRRWERALRDLDA